MIVKMKATYPNPTQPQQFLAGRIYQITPQHLARAMIAAGVCEPSTLDAMREQEAFDAICDLEGLLVTLRHRNAPHQEIDTVIRVIGRLRIGTARVGAAA